MENKNIISFKDRFSRDFTFSLWSEFSEFIENEYKFFKKISDESRDIYNLGRGEKRRILIYKTDFHKCFKAFEEIKNKLNEIKQTEGDYNVSQEFDVYFSKILNSEIIERWVWSGYDWAWDFYCCLIRYGKDASDIFLKYKNTTNSNENERTLIGDYTNQEVNGLIFSFISSEKSFLSKNFFESKIEKEILKLKEYEEKVKNEISSAELEYKALKDKLLKEFQEKLDYVENCKVNCDETSNRILTKCDNTQKETEAKAKKLEDTYEDKLRLSKPAEYWHKSAVNFLWQAGLFGVLSLLLVIAPIIALICSGKEFIDSWFSSDLNITYNIPRMGVIIFMLAIYTYLVRLVAKLTFSSLHLMRDAQEREQLTYVYLSLINENNIDEKSRDIVLQALFSRTETGLLANENGPTMPLSDVLQAMKK